MWMNSAIDSPETSGSAIDFFDNCFNYPNRMFLFVRKVYDIDCVTKEDIIGPKITQEEIISY